MGVSSVLPDLRSRLVLDDGTGSLTVNAGRTETERLWGMTLEACLSRLRDLPDRSVLEGQLLQAVLGQSTVGSGTRVERRLRSDRAT